MWPLTTLPLHHSAFLLLLLMSMSRMLSECYLLYDWDYNEDTDTNTGFQIQNSRSVPFQAGTEDVLYNYETGESQDLTQEQHEQGRVRRRFKEVSSAGLSRLSPEEALSRRERLMGLYSTLKSNPELMDRRLEVGSKSQRYPLMCTGLLSVTNPYTRPQKRSFNHLTSFPSCPAKTEWQLLRSARTFNDTPVQVFQPDDDTNGHQWFYTSTCEADDSSYVPENESCPRCCVGISRHRYHSHCMTRKTFVMALVRETGSETYDWDWIQVNSGCTCFISLSNSRAATPSFLLKARNPRCLATTWNHGGNRPLRRTHCWHTDNFARSTY